MQQLWVHQQAGTLNSTADVLESIEKDSQAVTHVLDCTTLPDSGLTKNHNPHQVFSPHFTSVLGLMCQHKQGGSLQLVWPQSVSWKCQTRLSHTESNFEREARNLCRWLVASPALGADLLPWLPPRVFWQHCQEQDAASGLFSTAINLYSAKHSFS